uniref:Uncharacterized protein LOC101515276 n=1 Tax=Cicer arietinum TaxID=3827 RepID=A0A1S3EFZ2_CICAR|nr:uncharacterized protein LOC101515276 [Cicer arietinum]
MCVDTVRASRGSEAMGMRGSWIIKSNYSWIETEEVCRSSYASSYYSWASATLVFLYGNLGDGAVNDIRQVGGYMTLLQCWIYEHFPRICKRGDRGAVPAHLPRAFPYLPERCLRQFGRIQCISRDVPPMPDNIDWVWQSTMRSSVETFRKLYLVATFPREVTADYYAWYISVSHPLILPPSTVAPSSPHTTVAAHAGPSSSAHASRDRRAAELAHRALDMVTPFSEIHDILSELCRLYED